ncbi:MAG TPA: HDIG domain-containing protein [Candidatus Cryosericum sp.]|nr:HDIG domain-containing protein [Candidatus Cryosericum sp.]
MRARRQVVRGSESRGRRLARTFRRFKHVGAFVFALVALSSALLSALPYVPPVRSVVEGATAAADIAPRRTVVYVDQARTEELRKRVADEVAPIYKFDSSRLPAALTSFDAIVARIVTIRGQDLPTDKASERIAAALMTPVGSTTKYLATCSESELQSCKAAARQALTAVMSKGVLEGAEETALENINTELKNLGIADNQVRAAYQLVVPVVQPNLMYDQEATLAAREKATAAVSPIVSTLAAGVPVVKKGSTLDSATVQLLQTTGLVWGERAARNVAAQVAVTLLVWALVAVAAALDGSGGARTDRLFLEAGVVGGACVVLVWLVDGILAMLAPFLLALLLGFVFFDGLLAVVLGLGTMAVAWIMGPTTAEVLCGLVVGTIVVIMVMRKVSETSALMIAGPLGGLTAGLVYAFLAGLTEQGLRAILTNALYLTGGGVLAALLALGLTYVLERWFNVATGMRLRELLDTGSKLLTELFESAPGTYHHSLNVANLASGAAQRVGADWLLTRVGGYYHDIGKLLHPQFFGENRGELPNIHEDISPELSTKVILEHVQAGVTIAQSHRLPSEVIDIIAEHHGTTVVQFFYDKAAAERANLSPDAFRYQGPKPHSKESSLVFLADGVEAAARSLPRVDKASLEALIENIIGARISDGQLSESQLTLGNIAAVKEYFLTSLISFYHVRDAYSTTEEANERV